MKEMLGPIIASTYYCEGQLMGKDIAFNLPSITYMTAEYKAMGTMTVPVIAQLDDMEMTVTNNGLDSNNMIAVEPGSKQHEFRWVHDSLQVDGTQKPVGYKAFVRCYPKTIPGISGTAGESLETETAYTVTRYELFADGVQILLVDRLAQKLVVNGKDYFDNIQKFL